MSSITMKKIYDFLTMENPPRIPQEENPSTSTNEKEKKGDINTLLNGLREIQEKVADLKPTGCKEEIKKFDELREIVEKLKENNDSAKESTSSTSERKGEAASGRSKKLIDKELKETKQRIVLIRKALSIFYDLEQKNFQHIAKINKGQTDVITRGNFLERINKLAESIPLFVKLDGESPPPLCGSCGEGSNWVPKAGDLVAAMSISEENNGDYILGEFLSYNKTKKHFVINDVYEQQSINTPYVIPLPKMRADPKSCPEALFPNGAKVMALFPDTTSFYPAFVDKQPFLPFDPYKLKFVGDNNEIKEVHQRYVIRDVTTN